MKLLNILKDVLIASALVFAPIKASLLVCGILVFVDLFTGIKVARKKRRKITSSGLKRTVMKLLAYETALMLGYLTQTHLTGDAVPIVQILGGFIGLTELTSILENYESLTGISLFRSIIDKLNNSHDK